MPYYLVFLLSLFLLSLFLLSLFLLSLFLLSLFFLSLFFPSLFGRDSKPGRDVAAEQSAVSGQHSAMQFKAAFSADG